MRHPFHHQVQGPCEQGWAHPVRFVGSLVCTFPFLLREHPEFPRGSPLSSAIVYGSGVANPIHWCQSKATCPARRTGLGLVQDTSGN